MEDIQVNNCFLLQFGQITPSGSTITDMRRVYVHMNIGYIACTLLRNDFRLFEGLASKLLIFPEYNRQNTDDCPLTFQ